jgi:hypothetical protein
LKFDDTNSSSLISNDCRTTFTISTSAPNARAKIRLFVENSIATFTAYARDPGYDFSKKLINK